MADSKINEIHRLLCEKSENKQHVFRITQDIFRDLKMMIREVEAELNADIKEKAPHVEVKYSDKGDFEAHFKFSGDTLVLMMHTNIFELDSSHYFTKSDYLQQDQLRSFCGMIQIYNFLSDSLKYNREQDIGFLIARIFINKDKHFFIDGKRPLSLIYNDIEKNVITKESLRAIIEEAMLFCLNFDLTAPPADALNLISVEQKNNMSYSSGMPTVKRLGFIMQKELDKGIE
ncbi:MAG: hypothetical protein LC096_01105 [Bacteroidia bacterium]|nr:hypothetical protein [Bacteroidia bacterium]